MFEPGRFKHHVIPAELRAKTEREINALMQGLVRGYVSDPRLNNDRYLRPVRAHIIHSTVRALFSKADTGSGHSSGRRFTPPEGRPF
jgi:hypothetical protein